MNIGKMGLKNMAQNTTRTWGPKAGAQRAGRATRYSLMFLVGINI